MTSRPTAERERRLKIARRWLRRYYDEAFVDALERLLYRVELRAYKQGFNDAPATVKLS